MLDWSLTADTDEPATRKEAMQGPDAQKWLEGEQAELNAHKKNNTWSIVDWKPNMNVIGIKWIYKKKRDINGLVKQFKVRLVAKGFAQEYGIDYNKVFAPTLRHTSFKLIIIIAASIPGYKTKHKDTKTAFLNANVSDDIYVQVPEGLNVGHNKVLKLNKALYGIKQAPREWNLTLNATLLQLGLKRLQKDTCIYTKVSRTGRLIIIGVFVDDLPIAYHEADEKEFQEIDRALSSKYEMTDLGEINHTLGMRIRRTANGTMTIDQSLYINDKIKEFKMLDCKETDTPGYKSYTASEQGDQKLNEADTTLYRMIVGSLIYAAVLTRPDLQHSVNQAARHMQNPTQTNMVAAKRILRYMKGAADYALVYGEQKIENNKMKITAYCDADWGGNKEDRKSTTGYCVFINGSLISWNTRKQQTVALSSAEAELMGICEVVKEVLYLKMLIEEIGFKVETPITINVDNQSSIQISENDIHHDRTKHIDIKFYFIRNLIDTGIIKPKWVSTHNQLADIFTKPLGSKLFARFRDALITHTPT
jgi:Reverse transcriptase (RNA-dependent DNA polymerase)